jgi:hypothetical protein
MLKYLIFILSITQHWAYKRYIIIEEEVKPERKIHKDEAYAIYITQRFARIPIQSPAQIQFKQKQVDNFAPLVGKYSLFITSGILVLIKLITYLPVINYHEKKQFFSPEKPKEINNQVVRFIMTFGVLFCIIKILNFFKVFTGFFVKNYWFNIVFNGLNLVMDLIFYVGVIKCLITFFELKFTDIIKFNYFFYPLIIMATLFILSFKWKFLSSWWGFGLGFPILGLIVRLINPCKNAFNTVDFWSSEKYYWLLCFVLNFTLLIQNFGIQEFKKHYMKKSSIITNYQLNVIAFDMALNFMLMVTNLILDITLKLVVYAIQEKKEKEEEGKVLTTEERIKKQFSDPDNVLKVAQNL